MLKGILLFLVLSVSVANASDVVLKDTSTSVKDGKTVVQYTFNSRIDPRKVSYDYINDTVQVDVPNAYIEEKKRFTRVTDEKIKNLYSYQLDKNTLRLRINYKDGNAASNLQGAVSTAFKDNVMTVTIDDGRVPLKAAADALPDKAINVVNVEDLTGEAEEAMAADTAVAAKAEVITESETPITAATADDYANLSEKDIPVLQSAPAKEAKKSGSFLFRVMSSFVILGLLAFGLYMLRKKWSKTNLKNPHTHIKVLTQHYLGPKKSLAIISVAGESILIGVTENNINLIKQLSLLDEEIPQNVSNDFGNSINEANQQFDEMGQDAPVEQDNFSISGIKDIVKTRLKTMREL
jgi:flagellar protein FliO/FliZ